MNRVALALVILLGVNFSMCSTRLSLEDEIRKLTGPNPVNCGRYSVDGSTQGALLNSLACGMRAIANGNSFHMIEDMPIDYATWAMGLAGTADGKIFYFSYRVCGKPHCSKSFISIPCLNPTTIYTGLGWKNPNEADGAFWMCNGKFVEGQIDHE